MGQRRDLDALLRLILGSGNVYFQPPESTKMRYPAIVYERTGYDTTYSNDRIYHLKDIYSVTIIDPDPDSLIPERMITVIPLATLKRRYTSNNLHHASFIIYY